MAGLKVEAAFSPVIVSLDDESRRAIAELTDRLDFSGIPVARNESETEALSRAKETARSEKIPTSTALLRMFVASETERERKHGFVGVIRQLERQISFVRKERDTFGEQVEHMRRQIDACHTKIESLQTELDSRRNEAEKWQIEWEKTNRTACVRQMFVEVLPHQERNDKPTVPSEAAIRLQTRIDCEEFVEKIEVLYDDPSGINQLKVLLLQWFAGHSPIRKDLHDRLPEFADALADNAVTNEGFAVLFGIDLEPVFQEVMSANMRKKDGPIDETGKRRKPDGWVGPDVVDMLRNQGWHPFSEAKVDESIPYKPGTFDSLFVGGKPIRGVGEFSFERDEDIPDGMCALHGPLNGGDCVRCENARYNGSEIDPIGEQTGNETTALACLAKEAAKVGVGPHGEPRRMRCRRHKQIGEISVGIKKGQGARYEWKGEVIVSDNVRPHIRALIERGKVTLEEYRELRCNSREYEALVPALSLEALLWASEHAIDNCSRARRLAVSYDEAVHSVYAPELIRRLRLFREERKPVLETAHNASFPCRFCGSDGSNNPKTGGGCQNCDP